MRIHIDINENHPETSITIHAAEWSQELEQLMRSLNEHSQPSSSPFRLLAEDGDTSFVVTPGDVDYLYAEDRKVFAAIGEKRYEMKHKLYELEELLTDFTFVRFSKSVIGNIDQIDRFEVSFNGNLCVFFKSGNKEYVSRKYVKTLRNILTGG
ncbi:LytTR family DNA-binding domain-containing protein [Geomicrobium sp. JSM 1781026]|uniref:LytTR family DNA-binding domain-containing protein n=1 Tax=Geomicrobium sp. JSM 1781026 TaxID=3344580 RepID=UPI0035C0D176